EVSAPSRGRCRGRDLDRPRLWAGEGRSRRSTGRAEHSRGRPPRTPSDVRDRRRAARSSQSGAPRRTLSIVRNGQYGPPTMRLVVTRCEVLYTGRLTARLPEAVRLLMFKADGSFLVHDDAGGFRP